MKKAFIIVLASVLLFTSCATLSNTRSINVSGTGTVTLQADMVSFTINVSETAETTGKAQQLANKKVGQILSVIRNYKIEDKDISTTSLDFSSEYEWNSDLQKSVKVGERVSQTLYVKMRDLESFALLLDELGSSVNGISFYNVSFDCENRAEALEQARQLAFEDALGKAEIYAKTAGIKVGKPSSISDVDSSVSYRIPTYNSKLMYAESAADTAYGTEVPMGNLCVTVNTNVIFDLK